MEAIMCQKNSTTECCQNPSELKDNVRNCSKEQIKKCHGNAKQHPCIRNQKEKKE